MRYHDKRAEGISLLRRHAAESATRGSGAVREAYRELKTAMEALLSEFRVQFDLPGTRYWEHPESGSIFSTEPGERPDDTIALECVELERHEFLSRQGIHFGYDEDAL